MSLGDYLEKYTYQNILSDALAQVDPRFDRRQGSIIYDALAPACYKLAEYYMELRQVYFNTFADTAPGIYLDMRAAEQGLTRYDSSYAYKKGEFKDEKNSPMKIPIGSRFSTVSDVNPIIYVVDSPYIDPDDGVIVTGSYVMRCEVPGTIGNEYSGNLINITFLSGVAKATLSDLLIPARDVETDDEFRQRYFDTVRRKPFGGNIADYRRFVKAIEGVGELQVYPVWNGGGTVKLSVIDAEYNPVGEEFLQKIQNEVDPDSVPEGKGTGLGTAPIGHKVTVAAPEEFKINISCKVATKLGVSKSSLNEPIKQAVGEYLLGLRKSWGIGDELNRYSVSVYISRIISAMLSVEGVVNVTEVTINGEDTDLVLREDAIVQQLPVMGELTFIE